MELRDKVGTDNLFRQIAELARGIDELEDYREAKKGKLQRTLYSGSSAASSKVNKVGLSGSPEPCLTVLCSDVQQESQ